MEDGDDDEIKVSWAGLEAQSRIDAHRKMSGLDWTGLDTFALKVGRVEFSQDTYGW